MDTPAHPASTPYWTTFELPAIDMKAASVGILDQIVAGLRQWGLRRTRGDSLPRPPARVLKSQREFSREDTLLRGMATSVSVNLDCRMCLLPPQCEARRSVPRSTDRCREVGATSSEVDELPDEGHTARMKHRQTRRCVA
jgi:hypothetical protein